MYPSEYLNQQHIVNLACKELDSLARFQWYLQNARNAIEALSYEHCESSELGLGRQRKPTSFAREMRGDAIGWWVHKKEADLCSLKTRTDSAFKSAEAIKVEAKSLRESSKKFNTYAELLNELRMYTFRQRDHIMSLENYAQWLFQRDPKAPGVLYSFRVWGSSRLSEREVKLSSTDIENESPIVLHELSKIGLGLISRDTHSYECAISKLGESEWGALVSNFQAFEKSRNGFMEDIARITFHNLSEYALFVRDSLRNVLLEIDKRFDDEAELFSDAFWKQVIVTVCKSAKCESEFWDLKESLDIWHATTPEHKLKADLKVSKQVAAFANAKGGALIVGVNDARCVVGVPTGRQFETRVAHIQRLLAGSLLDAPQVRFLDVRTQAENGCRVVCLIVLVPMSKSVVGVRNKDGSYLYPLRNHAGIEAKSYVEIQAMKASVANDNFDDLRSYLKILLIDHPSD